MSFPVDPSAPHPDGCLCGRPGCRRRRDAAREDLRRGTLDLSPAVIADGIRRLELHANGAARSDNP
jgi:hypothetical protein